jgi:hypothetical protein
MDKKVRMEIERKLRKAKSADEEFLIMLSYLPKKEKHVFGLFLDSLMKATPPGAPVNRRTATRLAKEIGGRAEL